MQREISSLAPRTPKASPTTTTSAIPASRPVKSRTNPCSRGKKTLTGTGFVKGRNGKSLLINKKHGKHPLSLWKDETLIPRPLEAKESIFDIIMPWVADQKAEKAAVVQKAKTKKATGPK